MMVVRVNSGRVYHTSKVRRLAEDIQSASYS